MAKSEKPTEQDIGTAMMLWYAECIKQYPQGLVTQAQAAAMLGVGRMAIHRLVGRGYIQAVFFPKPPDIAGIPIGQDDPTWLKVLGRLGIAAGEEDLYSFPAACFVSFEDVWKLWHEGDVQKKCAINWGQVWKDLKILPTKKNKQIMKDKIRERALQRERERGGDSK